MFEVKCLLHVDLCGENSVLFFILFSELLLKNVVFVNKSISQIWLCYLTAATPFWNCPTLKAHNLIFLPNKIRLNLINNFVMSRNKHISKKTQCFSRKRSKNKAKPNEFERRILKLSCYACSDNPICRHGFFSMFRNVSRMNSDLTFYDE